MSEREYDVDDPADRIDAIQNELSDIEPDNLAAIGFVVVFKNDRMVGDSDYMAEHSGPANGFVSRFVNPSLDGYDEAREIIEVQQSFDRQVENMKIGGEERPQIASLGDLLGQDSIFS